ncbi:hypothetical protein A3D81_01525 [Candidatus Curtissbacteria bacterium RIFCSPHIGHO2_02_FULL_40_17]|uniref:Uncharacterized protein n=4 Tax=Candidatus Curtissiibacteriota TaxID=1752717 RepID=A0A1F5GIU5_9BACT|nr:MAG: hypothetical protein A2693_03010 [Candidatus Curtissbacteria bacterium RIFCSPHIGHO2_01_FULL_40_12]OGD91798.1 MAG: hypothetical protein A3D81_01525 [Candidatus Curtissbacteria bacterium RIFCSPHIGHO2_02_FULL_40_17]OGE03368.1 MAG: hypothetical protein A3F45_03675 [Candidatus Curtissbacteria bacterium RIFCSPHIGHO2_12_FULL_41_17]OGE06511.1 MAG: hypothetical protein A3I53_01855 [Candidatus Curtissbacteria bacterium RIFCSPLOWO2_02_FULL_40_13b]
MSKTLQEIEDQYLAQGLRGEDFRKALETDKEFQVLLKKRKAKIRKKYEITEKEEKEYLLPNEEDYQILAMIKDLERKDLKVYDKELVELIKSQLLREWREPLLKKLREIGEKYT